MRAEEKGTTKERVEAMQKKFDVSCIAELCNVLHIKSMMDHPS